MGADIRREINDFYGRFATENKIDYADAVRYLNNNEVLEWRDSVEGYIEEIRKEQNPVIRERLFREYNARAYGSRITRLESLNSSIDNKLSQLYARANDQFREVLGENYTDGYYRTIYDIQNRFGYSSMFATVNDRIVDNAVSYPWSGANFSDRLWKQKADLLNQLRETLTTGFIRGESVQDMARRIAKRLEASQSNALRLIRTESSHIHNVAELDAYRECGFEEYEFMASLSERTCEVCGRLDGKRFKLSDKQYGVNFPPLHPNCRCTTIAFDPDDNLDDLKAGEMEYEEWKREFVDSVGDKCMSAYANDWTGAKPVTHTAEELEMLKEYANENGVKLYQRKPFNGDIELLKGQIGTISNLRKEFKLTSPIQIGWKRMSFDDFAETSSNGQEIWINELALMSREVTEANLCADNYLAACTAEGIAAHEMGHIIASKIKTGKTGLDIYKQAVYNVSGEILTDEEALKLLYEKVSHYSTEFWTDKNGNLRYIEIIPEVISIEITNPTKYSSEFLRLLREECGL